MNITEEYLPILDEKGIIIGTDTRPNAHQNWLTHGHVHVWVPDVAKEKLILQRRRKTPHKLDATIGWHIWFPTVEDAQQYLWKHINIPSLPAACRETEEEAWILVTPEELLYIDTFSHFPKKPGNNGEMNRTFTPVYLALLRRDHREIISPEVGTGFISQSIDDILWLNPGDEMYTWHLTQDWYKNIIEKIRREMRQI